MYTAVVENLDRGVSEVLVADETPAWIYPLFPAFLSWSMKGIPVRIILPTSTALPNTDDQYQRRLLRALGATVCEVDAVPLRAFIFNPGQPEKASAIVRIHRAVEAVRYDGALDFKAIEAMVAQLAPLCPPSAIEPQRPTLRAGGHDDLLASLRNVSQYSRPGVRMTVERLPLTSLWALATQVREYKYRQVGSVVDLFDRHDIPFFEPALVDFGGRVSLITPPVVEASGDRFILIQGSTRSAFCRDTGIGQLTCVVVRGVSDALPSGQHVPLTRVGMVGRAVSPNERYGGLNYAQFRDVERAIHPLDSLL
jgi:hypothetical protein